MFPPSLQKGEGFGAEQVAEVRALEEEACLRGAQLQSLLQVYTVHHLLADYLVPPLPPRQVSGLSALAKYERHS